MNRNEFLSEIKTGFKKEEVEKKLTDVYKQEMPGEIVSILSIYKVPECFEDKEIRTLSLREVLNAEEDFGVPFKSKGIVPIVDVGDNDYLVYNCKTKEWALYNVVDQLLFQQSKAFDELFMTS